MVRFMIRFAIRFAVRFVGRGFSRDIQGLPDKGFRVCVTTGKSLWGTASAVP
jgi:hypothetical protein